MYGLSDKLIEEIICIKNKYNIELVLFGSRARGDYKESSDIDLAVMTTLDKDTKYKIMNEFDELNTAYKIDLVFKQNIINERFLKEIEMEGKTI